MPQHPVPMADREKEYKTLKSRIPKDINFNGLADFSRKHFIKFSKKMNYTFELSVETNAAKSGDWNYVDLIAPNSRDVWKVPPFEVKPPESNGEQTKLYERIESMNAVARLLMHEVITDDAAEIFESGYDDECPPRYSYMNLQFGMQALYKKYCSKTVHFAFELRIQLNAWFFDQTLDPTPQFKAQNDIIIALKDMDLAENSKILALNFMLMLQRNSLYAPIVVEISNSVLPEDAFFEKVSYDFMQQKCKTFYGGVLVVKLKSYSSSHLKSLQQESLTWNTISSEPKHESINSIESPAMIQAIKALQAEVKTLKFSSNKKSELDANKQQCTICNRMHAGKCTFKEGDFCQDPVCKGKGMKIKSNRHLIGCKDFDAEAKNGLYCWVCGRHGISADKHTADCKQKIDYYKEATEKTPPTINLLGHILIIDNPSAISSSADIMSITTNYISNYGEQLSYPDRLQIDGGAIVSSGFNKNICITDSFIESATTFHAANNTTMASIGHGLTSIYVHNDVDGELVRLVFPIFIFESTTSPNNNSVLISEGVFDTFGFEFQKVNLRLTSTEAPIKYSFPIEKISVNHLNSCKWELKTIQFTPPYFPTTTTILDITKYVANSTEINTVDAENSTNISPESSSDSQYFCQAEYRGAHKFRQQLSPESSDSEVNITTKNITHWDQKYIFKNFNSSTELIAFTTENATSAQLNSELYSYSQKDPDDWQFEKLSEQYTILRNENIRDDIPTISMYNSEGLKNMSADFVHGFTKSHPAKDNLHECLNKFVESCPPFNVSDMIESFDTDDKLLLLGMDSAILKFVPEWPTAEWYPRTYDYQLLTTIRTGTEDVFSAVHIPGMTPDNAKFTDFGRVFLGPTKWPVQILYRDRNTTRRVTDILELHCKYGHPPAEKLLYIIRHDPLLSKKFANITGIHQLKLFCRICHIANANWTYNKRLTPTFKHPIGRLWLFDFKIFHLESLEGYVCYLLGVESVTKFPVLYLHKERKTVAESFKLFYNYLSTNPIWVEQLGPSPISHICIQTDNAPEFTSDDTHKLLNSMGFQWRHTADYVHQDNSAVENTIRKIDRIARVNFASAPWVPYTAWPQAA